jgi:hypothetical protein
MMSRQGKILVIGIRKNKMRDAIEKAIEGGWKPINDTEKLKEYLEMDEAKSHMLLDPSFWVALGKAMGWKEMKDYEMYRKIDPTTRPQWLIEQHRFIDALAEGKSPDDFFTSLLAKE